MKLEVLKTPLEKANLIEASAGTGKTYSIAVLMLRLLLEKKMPIEKILLVTFTEDAAKELKSRSAHFIRSGLMELEHPGSVEDPNIREIVDNGPPEEYRQLLSRALFDIDKAKISTIHSFCQQTLTAFAFETGQSFGMELWSNIDALIDHELSDLWRNEMAAKDPEIILAGKLNEFDWFKSAVVQALNGKTLKAIGAGHSQLEVELAAVIDRVVPQVKERVERKNILTFDDMIRALHHKKEDERLQKFLRAQYDAVFVDEFQDTDLLQYEIFYHFFQRDGGKVIFYIGDPKQSIYSFRNADLDVYRRAKEEIAHSEGQSWHMNVNFRSSRELLDRCNEFFCSSDGFHPFSFDVKGDHAIEYRAVDPKEPEENTGLQDRDGSVKSFVVREFDGDVNKELTDRIRYLLGGGVMLNGQPIRPRDIAVIMRTNKQCQKLKKALSQATIPAVVMDDTSIFHTQEATTLQDRKSVV